MTSSKMHLSLPMKYFALAVTSSFVCLSANCTLAQSYSRDTWGYAHQGQTWGNQRYERKGGNDATPIIYDNKTNTTKTCMRYAHGIECK
jgi:hypothetical protein